MPYPFIAFFIRFVGELAIRRRGLDLSAHQDLHSFELSGSSMVAILRLAAGSVILQLHFEVRYACRHSSPFRQRWRSRSSLTMAAQTIERAGVAILQRFLGQEPSCLVRLIVITIKAPYHFDFQQ